MNVWEIALGVLLGLSLFRLLDMLVELPFAYARYRRHKRKHQEMLAFMKEATEGLVKHLEKEHSNARNSSKKAKTASSRSKTSTGTRAKKVQTVKKGV